MERVVGWFVILATALMLFAFSYYLYHTAERRGWFEVKASFKTFTDSAGGIAVGDPVQLMGFEVGRVTGIKPPPATKKGLDYNIEIDFQVVGTNISYIRTDSHANFNGGLLSPKKLLDVSRGKKGMPAYIYYPVSLMSLQDLKSSRTLAELKLAQNAPAVKSAEFRPGAGIATNLDRFAALGLTNCWVVNTNDHAKDLRAVWNSTELHYEPITATNVYALEPDEDVSVMDRAKDIVAQIDDALPNFLALTNQLAATLSNSAQLTSNLNYVASGLRPTLSNVDVITANLRNPKGSLGEWAIPPKLSEQLSATLLNANGTLTNVNTNLLAVFEKLGLSLDSVAGITSNLDHQVQVNSNILSRISDIIVHSDEMVQGLKRHWLLRSAFKTPKTNAPAGDTPATVPLESPHSRK